MGLPEAPLLPVLRLPEYVPPATQTKSPAARPLQPMLETFVQAFAHELPLPEPEADLLTNFVADQDGKAATANRMKQIDFDHFIFLDSLFCDESSFLTCRGWKFSVGLMAQLGTLKPVHKAFASAKDPANSIEERSPKATLGSVEMSGRNKECNTLTTLTSPLQKD